MKADVLRWPAAVALALVPAAGNGFGRFAYALILPTMRRSLGWSALAAGSVAAANAVGYLLGALCAERLISRLREQRALLWGLLTATLSVGLCAVTGYLPILCGLRLVNGMAAAVAFVAGASLVARGAASRPARTRERMLGLYFAGPGIGIGISAPLIAPIARQGEWRACWLLLSLACGICLVAGYTAGRLPVFAPLSHQYTTMSWDRSRLLPALFAYGLFGAGYIAFMTFIVAYLHSTGHATTTEITLFWLTLGWAGVIIGIMASALLARRNGRAGLTVSLGVTTAGSALPLVLPTGLGPMIAAVLFASFFSVSTAVAAIVRQELPEAQWRAAIAGLTAAFGVGQCFGPLLGGLLTDGTGSLRLGLLIGTGLLGVSAGCGLLRGRQTITGRTGRGSFDDAVRRAAS